MGKKKKRKKKNIDKKKDKKNEEIKKVDENIIKVKCVGIVKESDKDKALIKDRKPCRFFAIENEIYCDKHLYFKNFTNEQIDRIKNGKMKSCSRCPVWFDNSDNKRCNSCNIKNNKYKEKRRKPKKKKIKKEKIKCAGIIKEHKKEKAIIKDRKPCRHNAVKNEIYCDNHLYFKDFTDEQIDGIKSGEINACTRTGCSKWLVNSDHKMCENHYKKGREYRKRRKKALVKKCLWKDRYMEPCRGNKINSTDYCTNHQHLVDYTKDMKENSKLCKGCKRIVYLGENVTCDKCRNRGDKNRKEDKIKREKLDKCKYCNNKIATYKGYCGKHSKYFIIELSKQLDKKHCSNLKRRGCLNMMDIGYKYRTCLKCREDDMKSTNIIAYLKKSARDRNIKYDINDEDYAYKMVSYQCVYCDSMNYRGWNGLDRIRNNIGYKEGNVLPCCRICNKMKSAYKLKTFIKYCRNINKNIGCKEIMKNDKRRKRKYHEKKKNCIKRKIINEFSLTEDEYDNILKYKCYYCAGTNVDDQIGLDRIDSDDDCYKYDNIEASCKICNIMKSNVDILIFKNKINKISTHKSFKKTKKNR